MPSSVTAFFRKCRFTQQISAEAKVENGLSKHGRTILKPFANMDLRHIEWASRKVWIDRFPSFQWESGRAMGRLDFALPNLQGSAAYNKTSERTISAVGCLQHTGFEPTQSLNCFSGENGGPKGLFCS
ncbi:hypothetical protein EC9_38560 [Rosistilla ulvae]|uniref:Uncharacterized protein n=1 Tax=Rosistilla ulvae TaxID=1930277 RepID=A0A517M470_9BACT|nr:hypothetical protein EC9_38560 [Rosistilla ulvae]